MVRLFPARTTAGLLGAVLFLVGTAVPGAAAAKTFISYFLPTPTACPVTSQTWGVSGVVPRDTCNGMESPTNPPGILLLGRQPDPRCRRHLSPVRRPLARLRRFSHWGNSDPIHAVGGTSAVLGPFTDKGYAYSNGSFGSDPHHGHNSQACVAS